MVTVKRSTTVNPSNVSKHLKEYLNAKALADEATKRANDMKVRLMDFAEEFGTEDEKGNRWYSVTTLGTIKRERRVSTSLNEDYVMKFLDGHGGDLREDCVRQIEVIDEDALLGKIFEGLITQGEADKMYAVKETFAFRVV